jgi:hypothetical protein
MGAFPPVPPPASFFQSITHGFLTHFLLRKQKNELSNHPQKRGDYDSLTFFKENHVLLFVLRRKQVLSLMRLSSSKKEALNDASSWRKDCDY